MLSVYQRILKLYHILHKNIKQQKKINIDDNNKSFLSTKLAY